MNTYITRINGLSFEDMRQYRQYMVAECAVQLGCREMGLYCYNWKDEPVESLNSRMDGIIAGINAGDLTICQFPTGNGLRYEWALVNRLKMYRSRIAIFVQEEDIHQLCKATELYNQAEVMIVPSPAMRLFLLENGIRKNMKFVVQEMWDDTDDMQVFRTHRRIEKKLPDLIKGKFGVVWYLNEDGHRSMRYNVSFSLAECLAAGFPVVVPSGISNQTLLENNHIAIVAESLEEASGMIEGMEEADYEEYVRCVKNFAPALRKGYYTKKCLMEAMQAFYRVDDGMKCIPAADYYLSKCTLDFVVLKESYGGNLALSWNFQGEADGFLIYGISGKLICRTGNVLQHYFLIRRESKAEKEFIVKAYVETRKGRMIVAESKPVSLQESRYEKPEISLIIPAYNAEKFIARSMDNALAQSFADLEIIAVDDGSQDRTPEILDWYGESKKKRK